MKQNKFQKSLSDAILNRDQKLNPKELLIDIFKTYVAKMMEQNVIANNGRLEADYINQMKGYLITEFKDADLGDYNLSIKAYSELFDDSFKEILNDAANNHKGEDVAEVDETRQLEVDKQGYHNEILKRNQNGEAVTKGGIILPGR